MAAEWTAVVSTALGAGIGGIVTIASLVVRGRQEAVREERRLAHERDEAQARLDVEDQRRGRDRAWDITMEGISARRDTYIRLLRSITSFDDLLATIALAEPPDFTTAPIRLGSVL
jgi:hypothetical protein